MSNWLCTVSYLLTLPFTQYILADRRIGQPIQYRMLNRRMGLNRFVKYSLLFMSLWDLCSKAPHAIPFTSLVLDFFFFNFYFLKSSSG